MIELRPYQKLAVRAFLGTNRGIVKAPGGAGKTIMLAAAIDEWLGEDRGLAAVWYANTVEQCAQAKAALDLFDLQDRLGRLHICCYQSGEEAKNYDIAIFDECHHIASPEFRKILAGYDGIRWGCSATPDRADDLKDDVYTLLGPIVYEVDRAELVDSGKLAKARVFFHAPNENDEMEEPIEEMAVAGADAMKYAVNHVAMKMRNKSIEAVTRTLGAEIRKEAILLAEKLGHDTDDLMTVLNGTLEGSRWLILAAKQELLSRARWHACQKQGIFENEKRNISIAITANRHRMTDTDDPTILVLVGSIEHGKLLQTMIPDSQVLHSKMGAKPRREAMEAFRNGELKIAIATSLADEGLDVPRASVLILAAAGRSAGKAEQRTARVLRAWGDKTHGTIHDFWDHHHPLLRNQSRARAKVYAGLDYEFVGDDLILPTVLKAIGISLHPSTGMEMPKKRKTLKSESSRQSVSQEPSNGPGKELRQQQTVTSRESSGLNDRTHRPPDEAPLNGDVTEEVPNCPETANPVVQNISEENSCEVASTRVGSAPPDVEHHAHSSSAKVRATGSTVGDEQGTAHKDKQEDLFAEQEIRGQLQKESSLCEVRGTGHQVSGLPSHRPSNEESDRFEDLSGEPRCSSEGNREVHNPLLQLPSQISPPGEQPIMTADPPTTRVLVHAERAHARLSPSTLESKAKCPGFINDPTRDKTAADRGSLGHLGVEKSNPDLALEDLMLKDAVVKCITYRNAVFNRFETTPAVYQEIRLEYFTQWGFCDILMILGSFAVLLDWKFAFNFYGADKPQFHAYCLGVWNKFPQVETIQVHVGHPFLNAMDVETFTRTEHYEKFGGEIAAIMAKADRNDPNEYQISSQCAYCGFAGKCAKLGKLGLELGRRYTTELALPPEGSVHGSEITDPAVFAALLRLAPIVESAATGWRRGAMDLYFKGTDIPGFKSVTRSGNRSIGSAAQAYEIVKTNFAKDLPIEKFLDACTVTATGLDDIVSAATPKGQKKKARELLAAHLEDADILQHASGSTFLKEIKEREEETI